MDKFTPSETPFSQVVDGYQIPGMFSADCFRSAVNYKPRPDDLFLVTYPKTGTTWGSRILLLIFNHGEPITDEMKVHSSSPFLEMTGAEGAEKMPRPGAMKVHLPYHLTPRSGATKYIYVARNPMDTCVSYFHHMRSVPGHAFNGTFDQFFEFFVSGNIDYGDYFDHLLGWYAHRYDPNVLFMTYEEMKEQPEESVLKMASFIDEKLYAEPLRNDPEKLQNVLKYSSFKYMKENVGKGFEKLFSMSKEDIEKAELPTAVKDMLKSMKNSPPTTGMPQNAFVRKGIIGDWKNHFNEEQSRRLKEKFDEKMKDTIFPILWGKYMQCGTG